MARSLLKAKDLLNTFWDEVVATSVYFLNRCLTNSVKNITPYEAWSGRKPGVTHLKVFGCIAYAHIAEQKRQKNDNKSEKCIFIGYCEETKGYRLYNPVTESLIVSRDVIFVEKNAWKWNGEQERPRIVETEQDVPSHPLSTSGGSSSTQVSPSSKSP